MPTVRERDGRWQAIVRIKKSGALVHHESRTFDTERLARDWGLRVEARIKQDGVVARKLALGSVADLINRYRVARNEVKPLSRSANADLDLLSSRIGDKALDAVTAPLLVQFARSRRAEGAGPSTVLHNLATLRSVFAAAKPMFGVPVTAEPVSVAIKSLSMSGHVAKSNQRDRRASDAELTALVSEFRRIADYPQTKIPMHVIVPLAVALPRRIGELCSMLWEDMQDGVITLRDTKHPRIVRTERIPVPPAAKAIIDRLPRIDERILPYNSESVSAAFDRACDRLGIENLHLHDLRHEGICRLFEQGLQIPEVSMISGHMSWTTLKRYTHLTPQHVLERLNARSQRVSQDHPEPP